MRSTTGWQLLRNNSITPHASTLRAVGWHKVLARSSRAVIIAVIGRGCFLATRIAALLNFCIALASSVARKTRRCYFLLEASQLPLPQSDPVRGPARAGFYFSAVG